VPFSLECKHPYDPELRLKQRAARWGQTVETVSAWTESNVFVTMEMIEHMAQTQNQAVEYYAELEGGSVRRGASPYRVRRDESANGRPEPSIRAPASHDIGGPAASRGDREAQRGSGGAAEQLAGPRPRPRARPSLVQVETAAHDLSAARLRKRRWFRLRRTSA
jgi:hypothetical protein